MTGGKKQFVLRKSRLCYLVTIQDRELFVELYEFEKYSSTTMSIADTLQTIGSAKLMLYHPADSVQFLKEYNPTKGWAIEDVF